MSSIEPKSCHTRPPPLFSPRGSIFGLVGADPVEIGSEMSGRLTTEDLGNLWQQILRKPSPVKKNILSVDPLYSFIHRLEKPGETWVWLTKTQGDFLSL
jgi:hypothetical protein